MATAKLTAELGMDGKGFTKGTKKAGKEVKTFSDKLGGLKTAMAGAFSVGVITAFTKSAIAAGSEIFHMAEQVGLSAEQFQVLSHTVELKPKKPSSSVALRASAKPSPFRSRFNEPSSKFWSQYHGLEGAKASPKYLIPTVRFAPI